MYLGYITLQSFKNSRAISGWNALKIFKKSTQKIWFTYLYLFSKGSFSIGDMWISSGCYFMRFVWSQSLIGRITAHASEILEKYSQFNDFCQINYAKKVSTYPNWQNHPRVRSFCISVVPSVRSYDGNSNQWQRSLTALRSLINGNCS